MKMALSDCVYSYNTIEAIEKNNPKFAVDSATDAGNEAQRCEDSFRENSANSPISGSNKAVHDLCVILQSIASLLL
ncbi:hypothetical protein V6N13_091441 [Hibiscus sabdariffa]